MTWDKELPHCFGNADHKFAIHPADEERAFQWLVALRARRVSWNNARDQILDYLESVIPETSELRDQHISDELGRAREMIRPWLVH